MKLSELHEQDLGSQIAQALGTKIFKKQQDPNSPEQPGKHPSLPYRSGSQDTPLKPRHRKFFNSPASGKSSKGGYKTHGPPLGSTPPANKTTDDTWGKRPGVKDI